MPSKADGLKIALPIAIQILVIIGGGIALFYQTTSSHERALQKSESTIIRKVDKTETKVEVIQRDVDNLQLEQHALPEKILEKAEEREEKRELKHKLECHARKGTRCNPD